VRNPFSTLVDITVIQGDGLWAGGYSFLEKEKVLVIVSISNQLQTRVLQLLIL